MNAAAILNFFIKKKIIKLNKIKIEKLCNSIGSDVILGIHFSSSILKSNNQIKRFIKCPKYNTLLVKPNFGCSTKKIYSGVRKFTKPNFNSPKKQMFGFGGMLSFELKANIDPIKFVQDLKIIKPTMSLAGVESTITSPALSSHKKMDPEIRRALGISDNLLRFSVGIENFEDLVLDLDKSLTKNG